MIKTINVKKEFTFRELMEYIIQNDVTGVFESSDGSRFEINKHGDFDFNVFLYGYGETYEVEVEEEITEDTVFCVLVEVYYEFYTHTHPSATIREIKKRSTDKIYALVDGDLKLVWERE